MVSKASYTFDSKYSKFILKVEPDGYFLIRNIYQRVQTKNTPPRIKFGFRLAAVYTIINFLRICLTINLSSDYSISPYLMLFVFSFGKVLEKLAGPLSI